MEVAVTAEGEVRGIEVDSRLLDDSRPARARISTEPLGSPLYDDPRWRFDVITALDVLEHIDDDRGALASMAGMLNPGGLMVITQFAGFAKEFGVTEMLVFGAAAVPLALTIDRVTNGVTPKA